MNSKPENPTGKNLSLQPAGEHGQSMQTRTSPSFRGRAARVIMSAAAIFGIGLGARAEVPQKVAGSTASVVRQVGEKIGEIGESKPTDAQIEANNLLKSTPEDCWVEGTIKRTVEKNGQVLNANLRDKPSTFVSSSGEPNDRTGKIVGQAEAGQKFRGVVVEGNNPLVPNSSTAHDIWVYSNETPEKPENGKFIHYGNFEYDPKIAGAAPVKLQSVK